MSLPPELTLGAKLQAAAKSVAQPTVQDPRVLQYYSSPRMLDGCTYIPSHTSPFRIALAPFSVDGLYLPTLLCLFECCPHGRSLCPPTLPFPSDPAAPQLVRLSLTVLIGAIPQDYGWQGGRSHDASVGSKCYKLAQPELQVGSSLACALRIPGDGISGVPTGHGQDQRDRGFTEGMRRRPAAGRHLRRGAVHRTMTPSCLNLCKVDPVFVTIQSWSKRRTA